MNDQYFQNVVKMSQALSYWLDKNNFDKVHICIDDTKNEFLQQSLNSFLDDFFYKETRIFNPAWFNIFDYKEDETFYESDALIVYSQQGSCQLDDITYHIDIFENKPAFLITIKTISPYGLYDSHSMDLFYNPFEIIDKLDSYFDIITFN